MYKVPTSFRSISQQFLPSQQTPIGKGQQNMFSPSQDQFMQSPYQNLFSILQKQNPTTQTKDKTQNKNKKSIQVHAPPMQIKTIQGKELPQANQQGQQLQKPQPQQQQHYQQQQQLKQPISAHLTPTSSQDQMITLIRENQQLKHKLNQIDKEVELYKKHLKLFEQNKRQVRQL